MVTVNVKLNVPICGPEGTFKAGDLVFLSEALAKALVSQGHAEFVAREKAVVEVPETRTVEIPTQPSVINKGQYSKKITKK